mmetsp:Transcript_67240/g.185300  ORF Transcript_67240/g.185300 Transcript_67240/m.185300 type:complete len:222 (+) Transcript_67240:530-1195(+)
MPLPVAFSKPRMTPCDAPVAACSLRSRSSPTHATPPLHTDRNTAPISASDCVRWEKSRGSITSCRRRSTRRCSSGERSSCCEHTCWRGYAEAHCGSFSTASRSSPSTKNYSRLAARPWRPWYCRVARGLRRTCSTTTRSCCRRYAFRSWSKWAPLRPPCSGSSTASTLWLHTRSGRGGPLDPISNPNRNPTCNPVPTPTLLVDLTLAPAIERRRALSALRP